MHAISFSPPDVVNDFVEVTLCELFDAMAKMPAAAPGLDGIGTEILKLLFHSATQELLNIINPSLKNAWVPDAWRNSKIIPIFKNVSQGFGIENIRPVALTSHVVKFTERILYHRIMQSVSSTNILSYVKLAFAMAVPFEVPTSTLKSV